MLLARLSPRGECSLAPIFKTPCREPHPRLISAHAAQHGELKVGLRDSGDTPSESIDFKALWRSERVPVLRVGAWRVFLTSYPELIPLQDPLALRGAEPDPSPFDL